MLILYIPLFNVFTIQLAEESFIRHPGAVKKEHAAHFQARIYPHFTIIAWATTSMGKELMPLELAGEPGQTHASLLLFIGMVFLEKQVL